MGNRGLPRILGIAVSATLLISGSAQADVTVDFEHPAAGITITNQYADVGGAGQGVVFGPLPGSPGSGLLPVIQSDPADAQSGTQVASISSCTGCEFFTPSTTGTFAVPKSHLSVYVGYLGEKSTCIASKQDSACAQVTLSAFDSAGMLLGSASQLLSQGAGVHSQLALSTPTAEISGFRITARPDTDVNKSIAIDDLSFDTPPPPDFSLQVSGSTNVGLGSCTASVPLVLTPISGFTGTVFLTISGLPPGVSGSFSPSKLPVQGGARPATLNLVAPNSGVAVFRRTATITATSSTGLVHAANITVAGTCPQLFDPQITSMQITQGTQIPFLPSRDPSHPTAPISYTTFQAAAPENSRQEAAKFEAQRWTVVRVYADLRFGPSRGIAVPAVLRGFKIVGPGHRVPLPGGPITPIFSPRVLLPGPDHASTADEGSDTAAYEFVVPSSWTQGTIELDAALMPQQAVVNSPVLSIGASAATSDGLGASTATPGAVGGPQLAPCTTLDCNGNDSMAITDIPFKGVRSVQLRPLALTNGPGDQLLDPNDVFRWTRTFSPVHLLVEPYATTIDVGDLHGKTPSSALSTINDRVGNYVCNHDQPPGYPDSGWIVGVSHGGLLRGASNVVATWCWGFPSSGTYRFAAVDSDLPAYSVPHEIYHLYGAGHASAACGGANNDTVLNLGLAINNHEDWPPDQVGYLQSVGLAPENVSTIAPYHVIFGPPPSPARQNCSSGAPCPAQASDWFSFMSYCGDRSNADDPLISNVWISTHNWNDAFDHYSQSADVRSSRPTAIRARGAPVSSLYVTAEVDSAGAVRITSVRHVDAAAGVAPNDSSFTLAPIERGGTAGQPVPMFESYSHADGQPVMRRLEGLIPASGATGVEILNGTSVLAIRHESGHPPQVAITSLPRLRGRFATVRWRASDLDRDPLDVEISYSGDNGRSWVPVWLGPNRGLARLQAGSLFRSRSARLRITVDDGFRVTLATTRRYVSPGAPPLVSILLPQPRLHQPDDAPLVLSGQAFDDRAHLIQGRSLRWMAGRRLLGTGAEVTVNGLPPGTRQVDLVAIDSTGRKARASVRVNLSAVRPLFLALQGPRRVSSRARTVRLVLASSLPATLVVRAPRLRAQRFAVGRRQRVLTVGIRPGRGSLTLRLDLVSGGKTRSVLLAVSR